MSARKSLRIIWMAGCWNERKISMYYYSRAIKKYTTFKGRATRREFWCFGLINAAVILILLILHSIFQTGSLHTTLTYLIPAYALFTLLPTLAVTSRRWHDIGRTGKWVFLNLIPGVGSLVTMCFLLGNGDDGSNQYGRNPRELDLRIRTSFEY